MAQASGVGRMTASALPAQPTEGIGPKALDAAVLRIRDERGETVGLGFLVSDTVALTCAHVVSAALGTLEDVEPPASARVHVDLPLVPAPAGGASAPGVTASLEHWVPPRPSGAGDVAVLRLSAPLPGAGPVRLVEAQDLWEHPVRAFGFPAGRPGGVWHAGVLRAHQADGWVQADLIGSGYPVSRGFSGTPVWDEKLVGVVGMVAVAESGQPPVSYLIPASGLLTAWPELRGVALPPSPFRGLSAFEESDASVFHGRRSESDDVAGALAAERWVTVVGPSGSGKSSLALAGVVPRLRADGASAVVLRPVAGSSPLSALAASLLPLLEPGLSETQRLTRIPELSDVLRERGPADVVARLLQLHRSRRLLIVIDQFEELLGLGPAAVDELADVLFGDALPDTVRVLITLRADFLEPVLAHPRLGPVVGRHLHALGPLGPERLRDVVTAPVAAIPGVRYEPHLADRILADTGSEPGALPLLSFTLDLLWQRQEGGLLTHRAYEELGKVTGALGIHADRVWGEYVPPHDEEAAQRLFTQLIRVPLGAAAPARRMAHRTELKQEQWHIAQRLAATRLLVTGRDAEGAETVELTHEALISGWGRLAAWAADDRSFLVWREALRHDMDRWERGGRAPELLPTAVALAGAQQWLSERGDELSEAERHYLEAGRARRRSRARRRRARFSVLGLVLVLALVLGTLFFVTRSESQERAALASSRSLAQAAEDESVLDPARGVMLALAAYRRAPTQEARNQLLRQYVRYEDNDRVLSGMLGNVRTFDKSRDGNVVLAASELGRATLFVHAMSGQRVRSQQVYSTGQVLYVMVSADGRRAAYVQEDGKAAWFEVDVGAERPMGPLHKLPDAGGAGAGWSDSVKPSMSTDGRMLAAKFRDRLVWWNLDSGAHGALGGSVPAPKGMIFDLWFGADDRTVLTPVYEHLNELKQQNTEKTKQSLLAVDLRTGRTRVLVSGVHEFRLSGDRKSAVACRVEDKRTVITLYQVSDGVQQGAPYREQDKKFVTDSCMVQAVDVTGRRIALNWSDSVRVVDLTSNKVISHVALPKVDTMAMSNPGLVEFRGRLHYARQDKSMITFVGLPPGDQFLDISQQTLTDDGKKTISVLGDGSRLQLRPALGEDGVKVLTEAQRRKPYWIPQHNDMLALDRTGRLVADREDKNIVTIREVSTLRRTATVTAVEPPKVAGTTPQILDTSGSVSAHRPTWDFHYRFDHSGNLMTVSGTVVQQWNARTGRQLARFDAKAFRPKGARDGEAEVMIGGYPAPNQVSVVVLGRPGIRVVDITNGRTTAEVKTTDDVLAVQFDPSGRYFALMRRGSVIELWRRDPWRKELGPLRSVSEDRFTPWVARFLDGDGRYLIAANNAVQTYRIGERGYRDSYEFGNQSRTFLDKGHSFMGTSKDGKTVIHVDPTGKGGPLSLDPATWQQKLCEIIAHREFTTDELKFLPAGVPGRRVCPRS
ncbi:trypsin-like peptidase domain-containing protein [Streptomyces sp. C36]|uniref:nSTAND1 domain-containing NTPase n=1 Tax=Streptomyces sp. C36 TaxID=3237122 RepID=UPI0034C5F67C